MTKTVTAHLPNVDQTRVKHKLLVGLCAGMLLLIGAVPASAAEGTQSALTAVVGQGTGYGVVSSTAEDQGTFAAQITVNVQRARPNTTFIVQRAVDLNPNGICTIAFGWFTFSEPGGTFTTSAGGAGWRTRSSSTAKTRPGRWPSAPMGNGWPCTPPMGSAFTTSPQ